MDPDQWGIDYQHPKPEPFLFFHLFSSGGSHPDSAQKIPSGGFEPSSQGGLAPIMTNLIHINTLLFLCDFLYLILYNYLTVLMEIKIFYSDFWNVGRTWRTSDMLRSPLCEKYNRPKGHFCRKTKYGIALIPGSSSNFLYPYLPIVLNPLYTLHIEFIHFLL